MSHQLSSETLQRLDTVSRQADTEARKNATEFQASDLRRYFAVALKDLATALPDNKWLLQQANETSEREGRMKTAELTAIYLGCLGIVSKSRQAIDQVMDEPDQKQEEADDPLAINV